MRGGLPPIASQDDARRSKGQAENCRWTAKLAVRPPIGLALAKAGNSMRYRRPHLAALCPDSADTLDARRGGGR